MRVIKAIVAGFMAAIPTFVVPSASGAPLPLWGQILIAVGAGITAFEGVYWAPKNSENSLTTNSLENREV